MNHTFAYECYADHNIFLFLRDTCGFRLQKRHSYSQGEVINDVLVRDKARFGMVDEDPQRTHHGRRDEMVVAARHEDLELRHVGDRHLFILRPALEECFIRAMGLVLLQSQLPTEARELRRVLGVDNPDRAAHRRFRDELGELRQESRGRRVETFITLLEDMLRPLV